MDERTVTTEITHGSQKKSVFVEVPFEMADSMQAGIVASSSAHPRPFRPSLSVV